jgi:hypothetical protein
MLRLGPGFRREERSICMCFRVIAARPCLSRSGEWVEGRSESAGFTLRWPRENYPQNGQNFSTSDVPAGVFCTRLMSPRPA